MIKLICVGKIKESYLKELINDYYTRINKYHNFKIIEIPDNGIEKEAISIGKYLDNKDFIVTLEIEGNKISSETLAFNIDNWLMKHANITFIIGGSDGISKTIKDKANYALSFGYLTYPHGLFRGIFLEQIYRTFKILNNETYHK